MDMVHITAHAATNDEHKVCIRLLAENTGAQGSSTPIDFFEMSLHEREGGMSVEFQ
jgi:hypothetical protein